MVTGANKGIGLEIARQLACEGVTVVLTARDEKRGMEATSSLTKAGLENVVFHQLDVQDPVSGDSLAKFVQTQFGRLDILVNFFSPSVYKTLIYLVLYTLFLYELLKDYCQI